MRVGKIVIKRRVWIGLIFGLAGTGVWWAWTSSQIRAANTTANPTQPFVRLAGSGTGRDDQVLRERGEYFDPTPLLFPTERNFGQNGLRESMRRQPGDVFGRIDAKLTFTEQNVRPYSAEATSAPERLVDVLGSGNEKPFAGMGQIDVKRPALVERNGFVEIWSLFDSKLVASHILTDIGMPHNDFAPLEFLVAVSSSGLVGEPVLMNGSGQEDIENFLRTYLVKTFHLGERLNPGRYRVLIGP